MVTQVWWSDLKHFAYTFSCILLDNCYILCIYFWKSNWTFNVTPYSKWAVILKMWPGNYKSTLKCWDVVFCLLIFFLKKELIVNNSTVGFLCFFLNIVFTLFSQVVRMSNKCDIYIYMCRQKEVFPFVTKTLLWKHSKWYMCLVFSVQFLLLLYIFFE